MAGLKIVDFKLSLHLTLLRLEMNSSDQDYDVHAPAGTYYTTGSNSVTSGVNRNRSVTTFSVGIY